MRSLAQLLALSACALFAGAAHADIALGQIVPLAEQAGADSAAGARVYIAKVNAEGGIAGHKIIHFVRDNHGRADETLVEAAQLIRKEQVYGFLPGAGVAGSRELVASGLLRQSRVPLLTLRNATRADADAQDTTLTNAEEGYTRDAGLIEIAPPAAGYAEIVNEYRATLAQYGAPGAVYSSAGLQGYIAAKVMVGAVRLLAEKPAHEDYFGALRNMVPDVSDRLAVSTTIAR